MKSTYLKQMCLGVGGFTTLGLALSALSVNAGIIASENFNYPEDTALNGQNGGTGWAGAWGASGAQVESPGLSYEGIPNVGNHAAIGGDFSFASREISSHAAPSQYWGSVLYKPGSADAIGTPTTPFSLGGANGGTFSLYHDLLGFNVTVADLASGSSSQSLTLADVDDAHMMLWQLQVNAAPGGLDTLNFWLDPTARNQANLGAATLTFSADLLGDDGINPNDRLANFSAFGNAGSPERLGQLVIADNFADAAHVPEPGTLMMSAALLLGIGAGGIYRRRSQKAQA